MSSTGQCEVEIDVRYAETDQMQLVHHANYLVWFELARTELCDQAGLHYSEIERNGFYMVVTQAEVKYRQGARYGDRVRLLCRVDRIGSRGMQFAYEARRDDELLATGRTHHVWVARETGRPCRMPEFARPYFAAGEESV